MADAPLKVTIYDPVTGKTAHAEIPAGSYLLLCAHPCYRSGLTAHASGTHQITVKGVTNPMATFGLNPTPETGRAPAHRGGPDIGPDAEEEYRRERADYEGER